MTALASLSDLINRLTGGNSGTPDSRWVMKTGRSAGAAITAPVIGRWNSLWTWDGMPGAGAVPTTAAVPTRATLGALGQANAGGGRQTWLVGSGFMSSQGGNLVLYDRLLHCGGLSGTAITAQDVGGTLTRNTGGVGNQIWVEIYTAIGTSARTITASYTNQAGVAEQTTTAVTIGGTEFREATRVIQLPLAPGDTGVRSVESVTLSASTGTAGDFGVTIAQPITPWMITHRGAGMWRTHMDGYAIPEIPADACLAFMFLSASTIMPILTGTLNTVEA